MRNLFRIESKILQNTISIEIFSNWCGINSALRKNVMLNLFRIESKILQNTISNEIFSDWCGINFVLR